MRVNLESLPVASQKTTWNSALAAIGLEDAAPKVADLSGEIQLAQNRDGLSLARLSASHARIVSKPTGRSRDTALLMLVSSGEGQIAGGSILRAGGAVVCDGRARTELMIEQQSELLLMRIGRERVFPAFAQISVDEPIALDDGVLGQGIRGLLGTLPRDLDRLTPTELQAVETATIELLSAFLKNAILPSARSVTQVQSSHYLRVVGAVEERLDQPDLTVHDVAHIAGMSPRYLQRLFQLQNTTFSDFLRNCRLERAREILLKPDQTLSIAEIAFQCGFQGHSHFSRAFRATYGESPRAMRGRGAGEPAREQFRGRPAGHGGSGVAPDFTSAEASTSKTSSSAGPAVSHVPVNAETVHWGYLSRSLPPVLRVASGATVVIETLTQHASDDHERMIKGDPGAESVFHWTAERKNVDRRGAGPMDASILGRGAGEGFGVHVLTGPIHIEGAEPGDILEVRILKVVPRASSNPDFLGRSFASNASTWWGYQYGDYINAAEQREVVTLFEVETSGTHARACYSFRWQPQTDPYGVRHDRMDYPGVLVDPATIKKRDTPMPDIRIPITPHFGFMAVAPKEHLLVDSVPPGNFGGNLDNRRAGAGSTLYLPVQVPGALFSVGDGHLALGDGEIGGTALESSLTGTFQFHLHKKDAPTKTFLRGLTGPLLETAGEFMLHGFSYPDYLRDLGKDAQAEVYKRSSLDKALRSAFRVTRKFLMDAWGLNEDEAIAVMSTAVDFGITQVADGNWGVHATIRKDIYQSRDN